MVQDPHLVDVIKQVLAPQVGRANDRHVRLVLLYKLLQFPLVFLPPLMRLGAAYTFRPEEPSIKRVDQLAPFVQHDHCRGGSPRPPADRHNTASVLVLLGIL